MLRVAVPTRSHLVRHGVEESSIVVCVTNFAQRRTLSSCTHLGTPCDTLTHERVATNVITINILKRRGVQRARADSLSIDRPTAVFLLSHSRCVNRVKYTHGVSTESKYTHGVSTTAAYVGPAAGLASCRRLGTRPRDHTDVNTHAQNGPNRDNCHGAHRTRCTVVFSASARDSGTIPGFDCPRFAPPPGRCGDQPACGRC